MHIGPWSPIFFRSPYSIFITDGRVVVYKVKAKREKKVFVALPEEDAADEEAAPTLEAVALGFTAKKINWTRIQGH